MELREAIGLLPVIYVDIEHLKRDKDDKIINWPPFPCWISCKFYTADLYNVDGADWIFELGWPVKLI